jgi:phage terminase large subunit-like protein
MNSVPKKSLEEIARVLAEAKKLRDTGKMYVFQPYEKQKQFFSLGKALRERMLRAGNQDGKTTAAAYETACHMTGIYPKWWEGRRFVTKAPRGWACGVSSTVIRDTIQKLLCGEPGSEEDFGKGMIPKELFVRKPSAAHGVANSYDTVHVKHSSGGTASLTFKSYEQGVGKFQSESLDFIWLDEEPSEEIYSECLTRTTATGGMIYITFTPLKGFTPLVRKFIKEKPKGCGEVHMTIFEALHIPADQREQMIASWPAHEREARANGMPFLGSNAVFEEVGREMISAPIRAYGEKVLHKDIGEIDTASWFKIWGVDFGIGHPFAAVLLAWDKEYDTVYVLDGFKVGSRDTKEAEAPPVWPDGQTPPPPPRYHASRMKQIAGNVPVAWPHDGQQRDKGSGEQLAKIYKREGLLMMPTHASFPDGGYSTEAGVMEMLVRMRSERFKVAESFEAWWDEFHSYYRDNGLIVKKYDDLMSATRIAVMQIRSAKQTSLGSGKPVDKRGRGNDGMCRDIDFDLS